METIYISHPYSGDEDKNREETRRIASDLAKEFPNILFINPLDAMQHTIELPYDVVLKQCIELLDRCDAILMTGDWKTSKGCVVEYNWAKEHKMPIYERGDCIG